MARTAEYSIKGYVYQFLRYLLELLAADEGTKVTIEGAIEDIDVVKSNLTTAVQCKYHEQAEKYTVGKLYRPILLMLEHFSNNTSPTPDIYYHLFCHFPNETGTRSLTRKELDTVMASSSVTLVKIINRIPKGVDLDKFLSRLTIEFGQTAEELQQSVIASLRDKGFSADDVDAIIYPAAVQRIVELATRSTVADRTITPTSFLADLRNIRQVTFTRWTRELTTRVQIFQRLRKDLKFCLGQNSRSRHFIFDPTTIVSFDDDIVKFIKRFVERYSCKYLHDNPPLFTIIGDYQVAGLQTRLHDAGLRCADGLVGGTEFRLTELFRRPMRKRAPFQIEFSLRLAKRAVMPNTGISRPDELFLVNVADDPWVHTDITVHRFEVERLSDLEYAFQLKDSYA